MLGSIPSSRLLHRGLPGSGEERAKTGWKEQPSSKGQVDRPSTLQLYNLPSVGWETHSLRRCTARPCLPQWDSREWRALSHPQNGCVCARVKPCDKDQAGSSSLEVPLQRPIPNGPAWRILYPRCPESICRVLPELPWKGPFPWPFPLTLSLSCKLICQKYPGPSWV